MMQPLAKCNYMILILYQYSNMAKETSSLYSGMNNIMMWKK